MTFTPNPLNGNFPVRTAARRALMRAPFRRSLIPPKTGYPAVGMSGAMMTGDAPSLILFARARVRGTAKIGTVAEDRVITLG